MKRIDNYINEKLKIGKVTYSCQPKDRDELCAILEERLAKDKNANLNDIDVSKITDMYKLFQDLDPHNIDISGWDVSSVKDMYMMFADCRNFNCDLSDWDVSKVENMDSMFSNCENFKSEGLEYWNVTNVKDMTGMFYRCFSIMKNKPSWYKGMI